MPFPAPELRARPLFEAVAVIRNQPDEDVLWNRPIFRAPPLVLDSSPVAETAWMLETIGGDPRVTD
ncbi:MAG: hypothetical protein HZC55_12165 [Verrucomicrobia bacterium]|nr:hypothetical protein [Verrucomicrobiota bacterium]